MGSDESSDSWLMQPLGPNDLRIHVDVGEDVEISDEVRAALDALVQDLFADEVAGFAAIPCRDLAACTTFDCFPQGRCNITKAPCFSNVMCTIGKAS